MMSPATPTTRLSLARRSATKPAQVLSRDRADALDRPLHGTPVGMAREGGREPGLGGDVVGILGAPAQAGLDLVADPLDRLGIEARPGQRQTQQLEGALPVLGQGLELAAEVVAPGVEREPDRAVLELGVEGLAVEIARALVQAGRRPCRRGPPCPPDRAPRRP